MPNIPLPPLQARLQQQNMITPIVKGTPTPMDVIQHQQLIDMFDKFSKGAELGEKLAKLPREGAENAAQKAHAVLDKAYTDQLNKTIQALSKDPKYANDPMGLADAIRNLLVPSGAYQEGERGGFNPSVPGQILPAAPWLHGLNAPNTAPVVPAKPNTPNNQQQPNKQQPNNQNNNQEKDPIDDMGDKLTSDINPANTNQINGLPVLSLV